MSETTAAYDVPLAPGTRVRERESSRLGTVRAGMSDHLLILVQWDDEMESTWEPAAELILLGTPARAPERALCPGIVVSADTCDGKPRIAGTRIRVDTLWKEWGVRHGWGGENDDEALAAMVESYRLSRDTIALGIAFHAGEFHEQKQREARKVRRRAWKFERGKAASEGVRDAPQ